jgi:hypothetical protein
MDNTSAAPLAVLVIGVGGWMSEWLWHSFDELECLVFLLFVH